MQISIGGLSGDLCIDTEEQYSLPEGLEGREKYLRIAERGRV